jgi:hypothetical protein
MMKRQFTASREELDALAVDRAAKTVQDIFVILQKSGHASYVALDGAAGAAGLLAVAHAAYKEARVEVEMEHEVRDQLAWTEADFVAPLSALSPLGQPRVSQLRRVPSIAVIRDDVPPSEYVHDDGTPCECDPGCTCHPPTRNEDPIVTGSWHFDTCPVSPKNRGKVRP